VFKLDVAVLIENTNQLIEKEGKTRLIQDLATIRIKKSPRFL